MPQLSADNCRICGDQVKSDRLGCPACLSCIIFFRRAVRKNAEFICTKRGNCPTFNEFRSSCRHCRYQKCLQAGMKSSLVVTRDLNGPRTPTPTFLDVPSNLMRSLVEMQKKQWEDHQEQMVESMRRATRSDVNKMFKWSFNNSVEWASQFEPFLRLTNEHQKCVVSEYGFAFFLIDQAFKSAKEWTNGYWLLQNGTFLHADYFHGLENAGVSGDQETIRLHSEFVNYLDVTIKRKFQTLRIDEFETAVLKTLLLFSNSFPIQNIFIEYQEKIENLKNKCLEELMGYLEEKFPSSYDVRFGKLLLFMGDIRSAVKVVYNHTKVSDLFDSTKFDLFVQSFFVV
ncbi:CBN-NHR-270 protein [Caenorhabditis brenneri]|uniref:CBN-NHR-270 protein n=1 Tax=Caenorhabditis brenneri TaxID=135651 RepID=G0M9P1_CAEBE|nr:CBN-NHR-270 protein [Caenorhabditis brenneri]